MRRRSVPLTLVLLFLLASAALAQTSSSYDLEWSVFGSAGPQFAAGSGYQLGFTLAQDTPPLVSVGSTYQIVQGYWATDGNLPTAVTLAGFWVEAQGDTLVVNWETASELDNLGFNLYRSDAPDGLLAQLNEALIPSQNPGSPLGAVYTWLDASVAPGSTYYYWLEDVDVYGQATRHGPVSATLPTTTSYQYYLPLVGR